jgi:thiopeptide-type bacteriocin biosynthesis protein
MPADESCLYTLMHAPRENHERLLREFVTPVIREIRDAPELDGIFFARYSEPDWQLRFRVLGRTSWIAGPAQRCIDEGLAPFRASGLVHDVEFATYQREWDRYGGERGMHLAEKIFFHDSLACLELIDAESRGALAKTRREYSLLFVERFLDVMNFDRETRIAFYAFAHSWPLSDGTWDADDLRTLDLKFESLEPGLVDLLRGDQSRDQAAQWGGEEPARIAANCLNLSRPVVEELTSHHRSGQIHQDLVNLAWSYMHMHCNRLGIDAVPEAILRYFMWRLYTGRS